MLTINNSIELKKNVLFQNLEHLYVKVLNFLYMVQSSGWFYCFVTNILAVKKTINNQGKNYCKFREIDIFHKNFKEKLEKIKNNKVKLVKSTNTLFKDIDECAAVDSTVKKVFYGEHRFHTRDRYTGVSYVSLSEMCKYWNKLEKLNE